MLHRLEWPVLFSVATCKLILSRTRLYFVFGFAEIHLMNVVKNHGLDHKLLVTLPQVSIQFFFDRMCA